MRATLVLLLVAVTVSIVCAHGGRKYEMHDKLIEKMKLRKDAESSPANERAAYMREMMKRHFSGIGEKLKEKSVNGAAGQKMGAKIEVREAFRSRIEELKKKTSK